MAITQTNLVHEWVAKLATGTGPGTNVPWVGTWVDLVGVRDGTLSGFSQISSSGWAGSGSAADPYCLVFDAAQSDNYVLCGDTSVGEDWSFTYEAWFNTTNYDGAARSICCEYDSASNNAKNGWLYHATSGTVSAGIYDDEAEWHYVESNSTVTAAAWHHIVYTMPYTATRAKVFIDNVLQTDYFDQFTGTLTLDGFAMGCLTGAGGPAWWYHGKIATIRLYSGALTAGQVEANYTAGVTASSLDSEWTGLTVIRDVSS